MNVDISPMQAAAIVIGLIGAGYSSCEFLATLLLQLQFEFIYPRIHESLQIPCQRLMKLLEWMWGNEYTKKWKNLRDRYARPQRVTQPPGYLKHLMHHTQAQMPSMMSATYVGCILVATKTQNRRLNKAFKCSRSEEATFTRRRLWRVNFRSLL